MLPQGREVMVEVRHFTDGIQNKNKGGGDEYFSSEAGRLISVMLLVAR
jgi:hypothetical protein